jgi:hypothetical protein
MTEPFTDDDLERVRDNSIVQCWCGAKPHTDPDGYEVWFHSPGCPVVARMVEALRSRRAYGKAAP